MPAPTDELGYPLDPQIWRLYQSLGDLVGAWVEAYGNQQRQNEIVKQYSEVVEQLYQLGWDGLIDLDISLPDDLMPQIYKDKHPTIFDSTHKWWSTGP